MIQDAREATAKALNTLITASNRISAVNNRRDSGTGLNAEVEDLIEQARASLRTALKELGEK